MPNVPYPYEVIWQIGHRKWFLNTNLFLIKQFLIAKFDCTISKLKYILTLAIILKLKTYRKSKKSDDLGHQAKR